MTKASVHPMTPAELKVFLEEKTDLYNRTSFIGSDPVSIPHLFSKKEDIEISGFLAATIAWGQRPTIIRNAQAIVQRMDMSPHDFVLNAGKKEVARMNDVVHRTFNGIDAVYFIQALRHLYREEGGMEVVFSEGLKKGNMLDAIVHFREVFFSIPHPARTKKHVSDPSGGSSAKRINMFLRWMVRRDRRGVDFGLWKTISPSLLYCPLDVHSGNVARQLGLLKRPQDDRKAVEELTANLRLLDPKDPVKYDFALFGLGVFEGF